MKKQLTIPFQLTGWDATEYENVPDGPTLSRITVRKTFSGELAGESCGELLMCVSDDGSAGYTIVDRITGELEGRKGSFVIIHGGVRSAEDPGRAVGNIVPGSGTDGLAGIRGTVEFKSGEDGKRLVLDYELPK